MSVKPQTERRLEFLSFKVDYTGPIESSPIKKNTFNLLEITCRGSHSQSNKFQEGCDIA